MIRKALEFLKYIVRVKILKKNLFKSDQYQHHNRCRLEHLDSLGLPINGLSVIELGAGIGDHTSFFLERNCKVVSTDARKDNLIEIRKRYPGLDVRCLDVDKPGNLMNEKYDIVYCYGLLYHLKDPESALQFMASICKKMVLIETIVAPLDEDVVLEKDELSISPTQAYSGKGCRPTRKWIYNQLTKHFDHVYCPVTQPAHDDFPLDWKHHFDDKQVTRAIFVASRDKLSNDLLFPGVPETQRRIKR